MVHHASQFWPDIARAASVVAATSGSIAAVISSLNRRHIGDVRLLLNGNLHDKLEELAQITEQLATVTSQRDALQSSIVPGGKRHTDPSAGGLIEASTDVPNVRKLT